MTIHPTLAALSARLLTTLAAATLLASACGGDKDEPNAATNAPTTTTPAAPANTAGIVAIGHSGLTAENSDPDHPGQAALDNSWATGTSAEVNSIYLRLVAALPQTEGHVVNAAAGGSPVHALRYQAETALEQEPTPTLVIVQTIDGDIRCDGTDGDNVAGFGTELGATLDVITEASPNSRILLVGQFGRPDPAIVEEVVAQFPGVKDFITGTGICDFYGPEGNLAEENFETLTAIIDGYETEQARVCASVPHCSTDEGAGAAYVVEMEHLSSDLNHLNALGQAKLAELIWPSVAMLLGLEDVSE